jgi:Leucine-rich repeat (LRR) protein
MTSDGPMSYSRTDRPHLVAHKIIIVAFKITFPEDASHIESIDTIAEILAPGNQMPHLRQLLQENASLLARRLEQFESESVEFPGLASNDKDRAISAILEAIDRGNLKRAEVVADSIVGNDTFKRIQPESEVVWISYALPEEVVSYARIYLRNAVAFLASLVRQLPDFSDQLLVAEYEFTVKINELLRDGINKVVLPQYQLGKSYELSTFESEYRSAIITNNGTTEVFGLNVPEELRKQPIDITYITLKAAALGDPATQADQLQQGNAFDDDALSYAIHRVDETLGEVIKGTLSAARGADSSRSPVRGPRVLLTGPAGSGKTTIAQWLAIRAAQRNFPEALEAWNTCSPFVVPLRNVFPDESQRYPSLKDLVHPPILHSRLPTSWLESKLSGNALIILDGLDELSRPQKVLLGDWVKRLEEKFPKASMVITSRPEGLDSGWLSDMGFVQLALQQMSLHDIRRCVGAWFRALMTISVRNRDEYRKTQNRIISDIERQDTLRELASTPLLCSMLCAFYAYRHTAAPETRADLYREVIKTLVYEREHDRNSERDDLKALPEKQRLLLLQGLARYMTDTSKKSIKCKRPLRDTEVRSWPSAREETAESIVEARVPRMGLMVITAHRALDILLRRSIVFRRVTYNEAQFAHRSIQEYLTACDYVNDGNIDNLARHLDDPQKWSIIVFAAGQLSMKDVSDLVKKILAYAQRHANDSRRRSLIMLAAECYVAAGGLQEDIATDVERMIRKILPPIDAEEADMVARCGPQILPMLERREGYPEEISAACVHAAAAIGGSEALKLVEDYVDTDNGGLLTNEIINVWQGFDAAVYAKRVLSRIRLSDHWIGLRTPQTISAAGSLETMKKARLETYETEYDFSHWTKLHQLEELDFVENWRLESLRGLQGLRNLRKINLSGAKNLRSIEELANISSLREIYLAGCRSLADISALARLPQLKVLILDGCRSIRDFSPVRSLSELMTLSINGCAVSDLSFCVGLPRLRRLRAITREGVSDAHALSSCPDLLRLEIRMNATDEGALAIPGNSLKKLIVKGGVNAVDLLPIAQHTRLSDLWLSKVDGLQNLSVLRDLHHLQSASIVDCPGLHDASGLANSRTLADVDLSGSEVAEVNFATNMPNLARVVLNRCSKLNDISPLLSLPSLEYVMCLGVPRNLYPSLERLAEPGANGRQVAVVYEPLVNYEQVAIQPDDEYSPEWEEFGEFYGDQG